ncbi:chemotaxis protein CheB [Chlorogloeopsis fritschii PCC 9212]|uniref:protein-glutamate methylesterase n=1 Tax=Chlorogloeopsis fritschii PCC 6912 TaxID=211165 RepID=A0A433NNA6_CHLFR|nr:chemotaxis protein CheB [Chlorogloeopsis fritschii]RUR84679.1 protein-glutamate methylesterase [Chlorogloeopsis fritschii PCC 6912]
MAGHDIIVVGASAGGVEALTHLVKNLPANIKAAIFIVLHVPAHGTSVLPRILSRAGSLPVSHAQDGDAIVQGRIYVAPPNYHLLVKPGYLSLSRGATENSHRPAVDPLFRTAARIYGRRVVGVILTGVLDDGTAGLMAVKMRGGVAVVQHPDDAMYSGMPRSAIENVDNIDYILPLADIPSTLVELAEIPVEEEVNNSVPDEMEYESDIVELDMDAVENGNRPGEPSSFSCPSCGGTLWEIQDGDLLRFRCRTGHAFSSESLLAEQSDALEDALWSALRALEEKSSLALRMAQLMRDRHYNLSAKRLEKDAHEAQKRAAVIRDVLSKKDGVVEGSFTSESESQPIIYDLDDL